MPSRSCQLGQGWLSINEFGGQSHIIFWTHAAIVLERCNCLGGRIKAVSHLREGMCAWPMLCTQMSKPLGKARAIVGHVGMAKGKNLKSPA